MHRVAIPTIILISALMLAGCGGESVQKVDTGSPGSTPTATESGGFTIGDTVKTAAGNTITVEAFEPWKSTNPYVKPTSGNQFLTAKILACANQSNNGTVGIGSTDFTLQMSDDTRINDDPAWREPGLQFTDLLPGDCVRGWVTYQAPESLTPVAMVFLGASIVRWSIP